MGIHNESIIPSVLIKKRADDLPVLFISNYVFNTYKTTFLFGSY